MTNNDKIRDEKPQCGINREAAKISALSSGKINKYINILRPKKYYLPIDQVTKSRRKANKSN